MILEVDISQLVSKLKKAERFVDSQRPLQIAAKITKGEIRGDAARQKGFDGQKFDPLTGAYRLRKQRAGYGGDANLRATSAYLDNFYDRQESRLSRILSPAESMLPQAEGLSKKRKHIGVSANAVRLIEKDIAIILAHELS